jgi:hypothetical protein
LVQRKPKASDRPGPADSSVGPRFEGNEGGVKTLRRRKAQVEGLGEEMQDARRDYQSQKS